MDLSLPSPPATMAVGLVPRPALHDLELVLQWPLGPEPPLPPSSSVPTLEEEQPGSLWEGTALAEPLLRAEVHTDMLAEWKGQVPHFGERLGNFCTCQRLCVPSFISKASVSELQRPISSGFDHQGSLFLPPSQDSAPVPVWLNVARHNLPPPRCLVSL